MRQIVINVYLSTICTSSLLAVVCQDEAGESILQYLIYFSVMDHKHDVHCHVSTPIAAQKSLGCCISFMTQQLNPQKIVITFK